jgi:hypothetical protein
MYRMTVLAAIGATLIMVVTGTTFASAVTTSVWLTEGDGSSSFNSDAYQSALNGGTDVGEVTVGTKFTANEVKTPNRLYSLIDIQTDTSTQVRLADVEWLFDSDDADPNGLLDAMGDYSDNQYTSYLRGMTYDDGTFDSGDSPDMEFTSNNTTTFVDRIVGRATGVGATAPLSDIRNATPFGVKTEYTLKDFAGSTLAIESKSVTVVPSPSALSAGTVGLLTFSVFGFLRRRRT